MGKKKDKGKGKGKGQGKKKQKKPHERPTCFVITGFGMKADYATGRVLNLDKTFEQLVKPAFDDLGINAFRAIEANRTGSIDALMYKWIYEADFVVADLSTLNANVFYELGVRHALKPQTTIIIAESVLMQRLPFDLSSFVVRAYEHGGSEITKAEQERFVPIIKGLVQDIIEVERKRTKKEKRPTDSPVFTFLEGMKPANYKRQDQLEPPKFGASAPQSSDMESMSTLIAKAEAAKKAEDFPEAIRLFTEGIKRAEDADEKPDVFVVQRCALVNYKYAEAQHKSGTLDKDGVVAAYLAAEDLLAKHCAPKISTDPETLGLSGAINKRLFEATGQMHYLDVSIAYYERGFYVSQDYYNGINVAFMHTIRANLLEDDYEAVVSYGHGNMIRKKVAEICEALMSDEAAFQQRGDKQWVLLTLAEVYHGLGQIEDEERLLAKAQAAADSFDRTAYEHQREKLVEAMATFEARLAKTGLQGDKPDDA